VNHVHRKEYGADSWKRSVGRGFLLACATLVLSASAMAQDQIGQNQQQDIVSFKFAVVPQFADCLRANHYEEPRVRGTVIRGKQNDTLILDMDGIKPNLTLSVFSNERSFFGPDGLKDPNFHGFGLSWYQSDLSAGKRSDAGHVRLQTVLSDETFGFDPDVNLPPTNAFHIGLWFDDPEDAVACGFVPNPNKPGLFNGEHNSGPLAFETVPDANGVGPLCAHSSPGANGQPGTCGAVLPALSH